MRIMKVVSFRYQPNLRITKTSYNWLIIWYFSWWKLKQEQLFLQMPLMPLYIFYDKRLCIKTEMYLDTAIY